MQTASVLSCSKGIPVGVRLRENQSVSLRHFNKQVQCHSSDVSSRNFRFLNFLKPVRKSKNPNLLPLYPTKPRFCAPLNCSISNAANSGSHEPWLKPFEYFSFDSVKSKLSQLKPIDVVKLSAILSVSIAATKWVFNLAFNPFFWMYFSWTWLFWPWFVALGLGVYGLYCLRKHVGGEASTFEQLAIVTSVFTWLTLVPPAHFNGFLEGWPFVFFFAYHYFFFFNVSVRKRLYGDYYGRPHDPKWDINAPIWTRLLFCVGITVGHWLAAFEGPELHLLAGGWTNAGIWILIVATMLIQYNSTLYLAKYSEKVVVPTAVVQFGPYRWVRHPIYASTILLFATYCVALRAPLSLLFIVSVCLVYYEQKAKLEEALMVEEFGERYLEYANKVRHKFIPFVY